MDTSANFVNSHTSAFAAAASLCVRLQQASSSLLQRKLKLGYNHSKHFLIHCTSRCHRSKARRRLG
ncbi:DNA translocase FtsK [Hymenobacter terricola]|uniref:DNA translocase FtsK n=1 Tax=Hymenobacter terricola TaxID=2819236 RepID=UPI001B313A24